MTNIELERWRARVGISQEKAAELLGVHRVTFAKWESGKYPISLAVELACQAYDAVYPGASHLGKNIVKQVDEFKSAYLFKYKKEPKGKHLVYAPWSSTKYMIIDFTPNGSQQ